MQLIDYLRKRLEKRKILLMTHAVVGYPSLEDNWTMLEAMRDADVDLVELQMPFSEPTADGPLFVKANQEALRNGIKLKDYFKLMKRASDSFEFPVLMMGYCNTAFTMGFQVFCESLSMNGGKGFIIPDLPFEECGELFDHSLKFDLDQIMLCTPTNKKERLRKICSQGRGFIYCVARKGVTGKSTVLEQSTVDFLLQCRQFSDLPLALGFGLSKPEELNMLKGKAEIAIVGTALLKTWKNDGESAYKRHLNSLANARD